MKRRLLDLLGCPECRHALTLTVSREDGEEIEEGWEGCLSVPGMRGIVPR